jgi:hypothetical protein
MHVGRFGAPRHSWGLCRLQYGWLGRCLSVFAAIHFHRIDHLAWHYRIDGYAVHSPVQLPGWYVGRGWLGAGGTGQGQGLAPA